MCVINAFISRPKSIFNLCNIVSATRITMATAHIPLYDCIVSHFGNVKVPNVHHETRNNKAFSLVIISNIYLMTYHMFH